jgi:CheY-like chemotaxis protein
MDESAARSSFLDALRQALRNLYDPIELGKSPLVRFFNADQHANQGLVVRQIVTDGIQALKPDDAVPLVAPAWRIYQVLAYCYLEQSSQTVVANNLGLSVRQLRRQQREAEQRLAEHLWARQRLHLTAARLTGAAAPPAALPMSAETGATGRQDELDWLKQSLASQIVDVAELLRTVISVAAPLTLRYHVRLECAGAETAVLVIGQASLLRQALLTLLAGAISAAPGGHAHVAVTHDAQWITVSVAATARERAALSVGGEWAENLAMARQLLAPSGSTLDLSPTTDPTGTRSVRLRLRLPPAAQTPVLVLDDNADTLRLFERYLSASRYQFLGAREPEQALALVERTCPQIIVLDVMLPGVDGWEMLGRLREHPKTGHIPVIVCTILPQEPLALALGAAAFLRKPVSRERLLAVLDQQRASFVPG